MSVSIKFKHGRCGELAMRNMTDWHSLPLVFALVACAEGTPGRLSVPTDAEGLETARLAAIEALSTANALVGGLGRMYASLDHSESDAHDAVDFGWVVCGLSGVVSALAEAHYTLSVAKPGLPSKAGCGA